MCHYTSANEVKEVGARSFMVISLACCYCFTYLHALLFHQANGSHRKKTGLSMQNLLQNKTLDESLVFWPALLQVCWFRFQLLKQRQKEKTQRVNKTCRVTRRVTHVSQCHKRQHHKTKQRHRNKNLKKTHTKGAEH